MKTKKIIVVGSKGRMGTLISRKLTEEGMSVVGVDVGDDIYALNDADLVVDFGSGESSAKSAIWCEEHNIPLVIGATGQTKEELKVIENASRRVAICKAGNFSVGVSVVKQMLALVLENNIDDIVILEKHHRQKKDSPSGTAIELKNFIKQLSNVEVNILSERGGKEIGTHQIDLYFGDELISIKHQAFSRQAFVSGVVAVKFMLQENKPSLISFDDIIKRKIY